MAQSTIFVTYNPGNDFEQTLAIRLQTIGAVHGYNMLLPDRFHGNGKINQETTHRINQSDYFIFFSISNLSPIVQQEIEVAFKHLKNQSRIIIIYDRVKNINHQLHCTEVIIDSQVSTPQEILDKTIEAIQNNEAGKPFKNKQLNSAAQAIGGILLVGLGLLALNSIINED